MFHYYSYYLIDLGKYIVLGFVFDERYSQNSVDFNIS